MAIYLSTWRNIRKKQDRRGHIRIVGHFLPPPFFFVFSFLSIVRLNFEPLGTRDASWRLIKPRRWPDIGVLPSGNFSTGEQEAPRRNTVVRSSVSNLPYRKHAEIAREFYPRSSIALPIFTRIGTSLVRKWTFVPRSGSRDSTSNASGYERSNPLCESLVALATNVWKLSDNLNS